MLSQGHPANDHRRDIAHYYKAARAHQAAVAANGGGMLTTYPDTGRTEISYASAPCGEHALSAYASARLAAYRAKLRREGHV